jgi:hypothetical protein
MTVMRKRMAWKDVFPTARYWVLAVCMGANASVVWAAPELDPAANIQRAVQQAWSGYSEGGMAGLQIQVQQCYAQLPAMGLKQGHKLAEQQGVKAIAVLQFCASLDWASFAFDNAAAQEMHWPPTSFFTKAATQKRIRDQFKPLINDAKDRAVFQEALSQRVEATLVRHVETVRHKTPH